ncbi:MAG: hypothetical protein CMM78_10365 [Rhodospirillaceae bacterium]|nr:hypothetical protein [Rhodospirillaceae bacterium]
MTDYPIYAGLAILLLLILSFFFSGSETALTATSRSRMHQQAKQGDKNAGTVLKLLERKDRLIGAILLGNNMVNILASALATTVLVSIFGEAGVVYATIAMTALVLIFAEVLPKTYALSHADAVALKVAPVMRWIVFLFAPITATVQSIVRATLRPFGVDLSTSISVEQHEEELRGAIDLHSGEDPDIRHEREMLRSILELDEVEVADIMTHRQKVVTLDLDDPVEDLVEQILGSPYPRLPVYRGDSDDISGVLHAKALLREIHARGGNIKDLDLATLAAPPWFIPDSTTLLDQLQAFRERREHFANVVDEYGAFMGIVTLEDILEQIVGEIDDETDIAVPGVRPQADGSFIVDGAVTLRTLARDLDWDLPDDNAATVAGIVLHEARLIPDPGQTFLFHGFRFEVLRRQRNQITSLRITPPDPNADDEED